MSTQSQYKYAADFGAPVRLSCAIARDHDIERLNVYSWPKSGHKNPRHTRGERISLITETD